MRLTSALAAMLCLSSGATLAQSSAPLSAIEWLSESVDLSTTDIAGAEDPVAGTAATPEITVTALDSASPDSLGVLPSQISGLPTALWSNSSTDDLLNLISAQPRPDLPALRQLLTTLVLAEGGAPFDATASGLFFTSRVDALLAMGAIDAAKSLLDLREADTPALFQRYFDIALLTGTEDRGCNILRARPAVAPTVKARIFCLARGGDWAAAALSYNTHLLLGDMSDEDETLLALFLDDEFADGADPLPTPKQTTPLTFRIREAIGEVQSTTGLPLAFAHADLRSTIGWKAQLDAAERLARAGALEPQKLQALFTSRTPSASGGVWDRIDALQRFEIALRARDPNALGRTLPPAWDAMVTIRSEVAFAELYGQPLRNIPLRGEAAGIAKLVGLLSSDYETIAQSEELTDRFLAALALGIPQDVRTSDPDRLAVQAAFNGYQPPASLLELAQDNRLGEALLEALIVIDRGLDGDRSAMTEGLSFFRAVGLEDTARRTALQYLILDRQR